MDVLYLMKQENDGLREALVRFERARTQASVKKAFTGLQRKLDMHLHIEGEYLYPELRGLNSSADRFIENSEKRHKRIRRLGREILKLLEKKGVAEVEQLPKSKMRFVEQLRNHIELSELELMPKFRELFPTQEREDLGQVLLDVQEDRLVRSKSMPRKIAN